jgi:signal transduction histidine kinase
MLNEKQGFRQRLDLLFEDISRLADSPNAASSSIRAELQSLEARLHQLESQVGQAQIMQSNSFKTPYQGWEMFLDAIHQKERFGFLYNQNDVSPFQGNLSTLTKGVRESVSVLDENVGTLYLEPSSEKPFTSQDRELVAKVAEQLAQQVENIRLLADASRARTIAEDATRQLTRENWEAYLAAQDQAINAFVYDSNEVVPLDASNRPGKLDFAQALTVRGEVIGQLAVSGKYELTTEDANLAAAIANQTSIHLETLRLNEELQRRAAELLELDRLKSSFLANMSHELRTPLNSILGFTDVMLEGLDGDLTENMENDLYLIQKNGKHLLHLINDVLDMAKIESGRMNLHIETFKVYDVLDEVRSITSTLADDKNVSLKFDESADSQLEIKADNTRLRQVVINLVNNAIKFTETGEVLLSVAPLDETHILISVKDTGIGIPPDHLNAIFQEFMQVDTSTTRKAGGTGLGLPISRRLVELHGGHLWAESSGVPGEGSTFFVEMPVDAQVASFVEKLER